MKSLTVMIKPASSLCNLRCKYCFYADVAESREIPSMGIMSHKTAQKLIENTLRPLSDGDGVTFVFQGGEPLMAGLDFFRSFTEKVKAAAEKLRVSYSVQTNGTLLNDEWCEFFKEHSFLVGISWDILPDCHNSARVDASGEGTAKAVTDGIRLLKAHLVDFNVLCTLTNAVARHPARVWELIKREGIEYTQFTPCMGELDGGKSPYALTPKRFAAFYNALFELWLEDYKKGKYRSIKLFDDAVNLMMYGRPTSCGMNGVCTPQLVIEADGSAYPCDFYCLDKYRLGSITESTPEELLSSPVIAEFTACGELPKLCGSCPYRRFCGGGCRRMRPYICVSADGNYCGWREFLGRHGRTLAAIAERHRQRR